MEVKNITSYISVDKIRNVALLNNSRKQNGMLAIKIDSMKKTRGNKKKNIMQHKWNVKLIPKKKILPVLISRTVM